MIRWIVSVSVRRRLLVIAAAGAILVAGAVQLRSMPVDVLPEFGPTTVEIQTEALGLSAAEVEQLITVPLEQDLLNGIAFLDDIRSESAPGLSRVFLVFEPGTDTFLARQVVSERLTQAHALPNVSKPPQMLQPLSSTNRVMIVGASSEEISPIELSVLARWTIVPRLVGVPGVANVSVWGFRDRQLQVRVDPEHLRSQGVSLRAVVKSVGNALWFSPLSFVEASTPGTGGFIDTPNQRLEIQHVSPISTASDLAQVRVDKTNGDELRLADVASVVEDHQPLIGDAQVPEGGSGLLFVVEKLPGANALDVTRDLEATIATLQPGLSGVEFDTTVYRPASYLESAIDNVGLVLLIGAILVALALGALALRLRDAAIILLTIPVSLVAATLALWALGATMNAFVLLGLAGALAIVIDDAIVDVDATTARLGSRRVTNGGPMLALLVATSLSVRRPLLYATTAIGLSVLPLLFLDDVAGAFIPDAIAAFAVAVVASTLVALTVTPALSFLLLPKGSSARWSRLRDGLSAGYGALLAKLLARQGVVYGATGAVVIAAIAAAPFLETSLVPRFKESQLLIRWDGPHGTSLPEMNRITAQASHELRAVPGVQKVGAHVGRAVTSDRSVDVNSAELWISVRSSDYDATVGAIEDVVAGYPGFSQSAGTFSNRRVAEVLPTQAHDVAVRIYGEELDVLRDQAQKVTAALADVDGITTPHIAQPAEQPTLEIEVDLESAGRVGLKPGDVRRAAATLVSGIQAGSLFERQKVFDVVVWGVPDVRSNVTDIRELPLETPDGALVRLDDVADVRISPNPAIIERDAVSRYLDVTADATGGDTGDVAGAVERRIAELTFPLGYHAEVLARDGQPTGWLLAVAIGALAGIFLLFQALFASWRLAGLALVSLPIATSGAVLGALAAGGDLSIGALVGLVAVFGLATRFVTLQLEGLRAGSSSDGVSPKQALVGASRSRVGPVTVTSLATVLVFGVVLAFGSRPGLELLASFAPVLIGGVITTSLFTLLVLPCLYSLGVFRAAEAVPGAEDGLAYRHPPQHAELRKDPT